MSKRGAKAFPDMGGLKLSSLGDLAQVAATLKTQAQAAEAQRQARLEAERQAQQAANLFRDAVGAVQGLKPQHSRVAATPPRPAPVAQHTQQAEQALMRSTLSDEFDPDHLLEAEDALTYVRSGVGEDVLRKLRRGAWVVQGQIDLHGLRVEDAREALSVFIKQSQRRGHRCVRVIHGKGLGSPGKQPVLKGKVRSWLTQKDEVLAFAEARDMDGGAGALLVLLRGG